jgi:hypothetical protein
LSDLIGAERRAKSEKPFMRMFLTLVVGAIVMAVAGAVGTKVASWAVPPPKGGQPTEVLLAAAVRKANQNLPMVVDKHTRLDRVRVSAPNVVQYDYTLLNNIDSPAQFRSIEKEVRAMVVSRACSPSGAAHLLDRGITTFYTYRAHDGMLIGAITVTKANCHPHSDQPRPISLEMKESDLMSDIEWLYFFTDTKRQEELAGQ